MRHVKPCSLKDIAQLTSEWDKLAHERHRQIASGEDLSFDNVLAPTIFQLLEGADTRLLLDIGSGTGDLTKRLARNAAKVIGIEPSAVSVSVARECCAGIPNVSFIQSSIEDANCFIRPQRGTAAVANMTLITAPNLARFAQAVASQMEEGAKLVATIAHPCFWPRYWQYDTEPWFSYSSEIFISAQFVISQSSTEVRTTHIHRPLGMYVEAFRKAGFLLENLLEPIPNQNVQALYPQPWKFPRFVGFRWTKVSLSEVGSD